MSVYYPNIFLAKCFHGRGISSKEILKENGLKMQLIPQEIKMTLHLSKFKEVQECK